MHLRFRAWGAEGVEGTVGLGLGKKQNYGTVRHKPAPKGRLRGATGHVSACE